MTKGGFMSALEPGTFEMGTLEAGTLEMDVLEMDVLERERVGSVAKESVYTHRSK